MLRQASRGPAVQALAQPAVLAPLVAVLLVLALQALGAWRPIDRFWYDHAATGSARFALRDVALVAIDDESVARVGPWPWPAATLARLVDRLGVAGARSVVLAVDLSAAPADATLAQAIGRNARTLLAQHQNGDALVAPQPGYAAGAIGVGHVDWLRDADGVARRVVMVPQSDGFSAPSLALLAAARQPRRVEAAPASAAASSKASDAAASSAASAAPPGVADGRLSIAGHTLVLDAEGAVGPRWLSSGEVPPAARQSAHLLLSNAGSAARYAGKVVLIGATLPGAPAIDTPAREAVPEVEALAQVVSALLGGQVLQAAPAGGPLAVLAALASVFGVRWLGGRFTPASAWLWVLLIAGGLLVASNLIAQLSTLWWSGVMPAIAWLAAQAALVAARRARPAGWADTEGAAVAGQPEWAAAADSAGPALAASDDAAVLPLAQVKEQVQAQAVQRGSDDRAGAESGARALRADAERASPGPLVAPADGARAPAPAASTERAASSSPAPGPVTAPTPAHAHALTPAMTHAPAPPSLPAAAPAPHPATAAAQSPAAEEPAARRGPAAAPGFEATVIEPHRPTDMPTLGYFPLVREAARGALGSVYLARDPANGYPVALQTLALADFFDRHALPLARKDLARQVEAAAGLRHPDIVSTLGCGEDNGLDYVVSEWVDGDSLAHLVRNGSVQQAVPGLLRTLSRVSKAVAYAHRQGLMHGAIRPSQILVDPTAHRVMLQGFASAHTVRDVALRQGVGNVLAFIAPEMLSLGRRSRGQPRDPRSDIYGLAATLYYCLTGQPPRMSAGGRFAPDLRAARPELPEALAELLTHALDPKPAQRPRDGLSFAESLQAVFELMGGVPSRPLPLRDVN